MAKAGDVTIELRAPSDKLAADLAVADRKIKSFAEKQSGSFGKITDALSGAVGLNVGRLLTVAGIGLATRALVNAADAALDFAHNIEDTARLVGLSTDAFQEWTFAALESGVSTEVLNKALIGMNRNLSIAAHDSTSSAFNIFHQLGMSAKDANGEIKDTDSAFKEVLDRINALQSQAEKTNVARAIFGTGGESLLKLLEFGSDGLQKFRDQAHEFGIVIDEEMIENADIAGRTFDALTSILKSQGTVLVLEAAPALIEFGQALIFAAKGAQTFFDEFRAPENARTLEGIVEGIEELEGRLRQLTPKLFFPGGGRGPDTQSVLAEAQRTQDKLNDLREQLRKRTVGGANPGPENFNPLDHLLPKPDPAAENKKRRELEQEAKRLERELAEQQRQIAASLQEEQSTVESTFQRRLESEAALQDALGETADAEALRLQLAERKFVLDRARVVETTQSVEESEKALNNLTLAYQAEMEKAALETNEVWEGLKEFGIRGLSDALADLAITGELTFQSLAASFLEEFVQVAIEQGVRDLADSLASIGKGAGSGTLGFLGSIASVFMASGGVVTKPTLAVVGESGPEAVIPLSQFGGGGATEIHIHEAAGTKASVKQSRGGTRVDVQMKNLMMDDVASGGPLSRTFERTYGLTRKGHSLG